MNSNLAFLSLTTRKEFISGAFKTLYAGSTPNAQHLLVNTINLINYKQKYYEKINNVEHHYN
jgi:hypothetical protein